MPHVATASSAERVAEIFTLAFRGDPVWDTWAFPETEGGADSLIPFWRFFVDAALSYEWIWLTEGEAAAASWIPPGRPEVPEEYLPKMEPMLIDVAGAEQAAVLMEGFEAFDSSHPKSPPHYYLSLLGTHPDLRGRGIGMDLLADNLDEIDAQGMPAYLESSNPVNDHRYERLGFERQGEFRLPDGPVVTTMWREART
jgi:GNAT superfamily N-acetyltransferase